MALHFIFVIMMRCVLQTEQKKQAAADVLFHYSQFVMVCIGEGVRPTDLRLHLMKVYFINLRLTFCGLLMMCIFRLQN